ncbi:flagellar hook-length control protein [Alkaliphilus metalliredigens QYMF]|uniref:Flagellar hook-length control protein n=1 Tax=Alkaliphilus metalliredigens (strain QYMF) TaxID=293826 RepID=A6TRQ3_ALKMQ|nr:flagellar hook-length control protein FliK [Alkaliphilus metalliredigens]ABR48871.1 flagellar hook-length control protein [Alkaliphilus metalliredigens QYMF]
MNIMNMIAANSRITVFQKNHANSLDKSEQNKGFRDHLDNKMNTQDSKRDDKAMGRTDTSTREKNINQESSTDQKLQKSNDERVSNEDQRDDKQKSDPHEELKHEDDVTLAALVNQFINFEIIEELAEKDLEEFQTLLSLKELELAKEGLDVKAVVEILYTAISEIELLSQVEGMDQLKGQLEALISELNSLEMKALNVYFDNQVVATPDKTLMDQSKKLETAQEVADMDAHQKMDESTKVNPQMNLKEHIKVEEEVDVKESPEVSTYQKVQLQGQSESLQNDIFTETDLENDVQNIVLEHITQGRMESFDPERIQETTAKSLIDPQELIEKLVDKIKFNVNLDRSEMQFQLQPENLGKVSVKVSFDSGEVIAKVYAQSIQVKEIIEANLNQLRDALTEQGLAIGQLDVSVGQDSREAFQQFEQWGLGKATKKNKGQNVNYGGNIDLAKVLPRNPYLTASQFDHLA